MDRVSQLKNVAFGGAWSEQIAGDEALAKALAHLKGAADRTVDEDLRLDAELRISLQIVAKVHPKGVELIGAWDRALGLTFAGSRYAELRRLYGLFEIALRGRLGNSF